MELWKNITKEQLSALYWDEGLTVRAIADQHSLGSESVRKKMARMKISRRTRGANRKFNPSRDELHDLYQRITMQKIARLYGVGETVVWNRMQEYGIKLKGYEKGGHLKKPGRVCTESHKRALSTAKRANPRRGAANPNWKGGLAAESWQLRQRVEYKDWRKNALNRAGNKCEECGRPQDHVCECCGVKTRLHVHHIESFAKAADKRYDPENSEVLCPKCHHQRHNGKSGELLETPNE